MLTYVICRLVIREDFPASLPKSRRSLLEELNEDFGPAGVMHDISFDDLESFARRIQKRFLSVAAVDATRQPTRDPFVFGPPPPTTTAMDEPMASSETATEDALPRDDADPFENDFEVAPDPSHLDGAFDSEGPLTDHSQGAGGESEDAVLRHSVLFMRDASWYYELTRATAEGDIGQVFEVLKVRPSWLSVSQVIDAIVLASTVLLLGSRINKLRERDAQASR